MCEDCGCGDPNVVPIDVHERILSDNEHQARHNRAHFDAAGVFAVNLMGSPGAGKTALLEATARALAGTKRLSAVSGDLATDNDAARLQRAGIPASAITTGSACHLDAAMVHRALHDHRIDGVDWLFVENVGNLVCPAVYDLGEHANVVVLSVTEGDDKPLKYPVMFRKAELVVVTKTDLLPHLPGSSLTGIEESLARVMPAPRMIPVSAITGHGIDDWIAWVGQRQLATTAE